MLYGSALSYRASSQAPRFKESERTNSNLTETGLRTPTDRRQPVGYLQSVVELNPRQLERNPNQRLERDLNPGQPHANPSPGAIDHTAPPWL